MHAIALGLVGFRLFFAAIGSVFSVPYVERHPGARTLTVIAGTRAAIVGASSALAATGAPLSVLLVLVALDAVVSGPYRPAQSTMLPVLARTPRELAASAAGLARARSRLACVFSRTAMALAAGREARYLASSGSRELAP